MTSQQRASRVTGIADQLFSYLDQGRGPVPAGALLRNFCRDTKTPASDAEIALSMLINQQRVRVNREMKLEASHSATA